MLCLGLLTILSLVGLFTFSASALVFGLSVLGEFVLVTLAQVYLFTTARLPRTDTWTWAFLLVVGTALALPVFFFVVVWPEATSGVAAQRPPHG